MQKLVKFMKKNEHTDLSTTEFAQAWKVLEYTGLSWKVLENKICLEKSLNFTIYRRIQVFRDLNQYKIVVPLFGAAYAEPNKGTTILY